MERLEGAKGQLADGAERVASAVERTADELEGDGDDTVSGFGRSLAGLMRQLAGGLRERDIEQFASELGLLARRNPAVFLAGSVALGFGVARFFKARAPGRSTGYRSDYRPAALDSHHGEWPGDGERSGRPFEDAEENLDLSSNPSSVARGDETSRTTPGAGTTERNDGAAGAGQPPPVTARTDDRGAAKSRAGSKGKTKPQRSAAAVDRAADGYAQGDGAAGPDGRAPGASDDAPAGGASSGATRGGQQS